MDARDDATWRAVSNGSGKRHWGASRFAGREWACDSKGNIRKVASYESAQRMADKLNA